MMEDWVLDASDYACWKALHEKNLGLDFTVFPIAIQVLALVRNTPTTFHVLTS